LPQTTQGLTATDARWGVIRTDELLFLQLEHPVLPPWPSDSCVDRVPEVPTRLGRAIRANTP